MASNKKNRESQPDVLTGGRGKSQKKNKLSSKAKKIIAIVVCAAVVIGGASAYVATGKMADGPLSYFQVPQKVGAAASSGKIKITPAQVNFRYATIKNNMSSMVSQYSQFGLDFGVDFDKDLNKQKCTDKMAMLGVTKNEDGSYPTVQEYLVKAALDQQYEVERYYAEAVAAGKDTLTDEEQKSIDDNIKSLKEQAETGDSYGNKYTLNAYLKLMGRGITEKLVRTELKKSTISANYKNSLTEEASKKSYSDADLEKQMNDNKEDYYSVDFRYFKAADEAAAKKMLKELKDDASNFTELCVKYSASDADKKTYADVTKSTADGVVKSEITARGVSEDGAKWLLASDRKANDKTQSGAYVLFLNKTAYLDSTKTVNVRHILIKPADTASEATEKEWNTAKEKAEKIYKEWQSGKKTEDSFGELAKTNSEDTSNASSGGLINDVKKGQMVTEFNDWCFAAGRKAGDTAIVKTADYGYHIIYFVGTGDVYWKVQAKEALTTNAADTIAKDLEKKYEFKTNWFGLRFVTNNKRGFGY